jgi:hypothetical protein
MDPEAVMRIAKYAKRYHAEYLDGVYPDPEVMRSHWWEAYKFLADKMFFQTRSEKTATIARDTVERLLVKYVNTETPDGLRSATKKTLQKMRLKLLRTKEEGKSYIRKSDVEMLFGIQSRSKKKKKIGVLQYLKELPDANIIGHSISEISAGRLPKLYRNLKKIKGIGHNTSSTFLRDVVDIYYDDLEPSLSAVEIQMYLQPVDSCIKRIASQVEISFEKSGVLHQARRITEACRQVSISRRFPISFSQGAYWFGKNAFEAALDLLTLGTRGLETTVSRRSRRLRDSES